MSRFRPHPLGCIAAVILLLGCADTNHDPAAPTSPQFAKGSGAVLLECPTNSARSARGVIGAKGGTLSLDGHRISVPVGVLLWPTEIEIVAPVSNYMEVRIRAAGQDGFEFREPVSITISYERCNRSNIDKRSLSIWNIDPATKELLEHMGGTDDKESRTVTISTGHLSGYAIAE